MVKLTSNPLAKHCQGGKAFGNILGKEENAGNPHFLLSPKYFQKLYP